MDAGENHVLNAKLHRKAGNSRLEADAILTAKRRYAAAQFFTEFPEAGVRVALDRADQKFKGEATDE